MQRIVFAAFAVFAFLFCFQPVATLDAAGRPILKPQNSIVWYQQVLDRLGKFL